jgi:hypothetical protein
MKSIARKSLRAAIDGKCFDCTYDPAAAGTKRVQITLCSCTGCPLWPHRPQTKAPIPDSVLKYYGIKPDDPCLNSIPTLGEGRNGHLTEKTPSVRMSGPETVH